MIIILFLLILPLFLNVKTSIIIKSLWCQEHQTIACGIVQGRAERAAASNAPFSTIKVWPHKRQRRRRPDCRQVQPSNCLSPNATSLKTSYFIARYYFDFTNAGALEEGLRQSVKVNGRFATPIWSLPAWLSRGRYKRMKTDFGEKSCSSANPCFQVVSQHTAKRLERIA